MVSRSVKFTLVANWIFACVLSFLVLVYWDEDTPLPVQAGIIVGEWDQSKPADELYSEIEQFANENEITVGRLEDDLRGEQGGRTLYLVNGDPSVAADEWLDGGYDDFTQSVTTRVRPFAEAGERDPTGAYVVFGDDDKAAELGDFFAAQGLEVTEQFNRWSLSPQDLMIQGSQVVALGMMVLVSVAVAAAGVLMGARAYGVNRLHGLGYASLLLHDVRAVLVYWALAGIAAIGVAVGVLAAYNGLTGIGLYLLTAFTISTVLTGAVIAAHALVLLLLMQLGVLAAVKGELPGRTASAVAYSLRVVTLVATLILAQQAIAAGMDVEQRSETIASYEQLGNTSRVTLGEVWSSEDRTSVLENIGTWLRDEDQSGNLLLAGQQYVEYPSVRSGKTLIYANDNFFRDQTITLSDGTTFTGDDAVEPTVLLPPGLWEHRDEIRQKVLRSPDIRDDNNASVNFNQVKMAADQEVFTYTPEQAGPSSPENADVDESFVANPIIVFLPSEQGLLTEHSYAAFASQGRVLFPDPQGVFEAVTNDPAIGDYVVAVTPVVEHAATELRDVLQEFRLALFSAFAGVVVLLITGVGAVLIHARRNAQWIFARHVSGWRFTAVHRVLLTFEAGVIAVLIGWLPYRAWSINSDLVEYQRTGVPAPFEPMTLGTPEWTAIALLAALTVGGVLTALIRAHRRVIRNGASDA